MAVVTVKLTKTTRKNSNLNRNQNTENILTEGREGLEESDKLTRVSPNVPAYPDIELNLGWRNGISDNLGCQKVRVTWGDDSERGTA